MSQQIYLQNKYTKIYYSIISRAIDRECIGYTEKHHIVPKSIGGSNSKDNLVRLTAKEHYICHLLLTKMLLSENRSKMVYALWIMNAKNKTQDRVKMTGVLYAKVKQEYSELVRQKRKGNPLSAETKEKISKALKGKPIPGYKGKSELWYKRHAETHRGKPNNLR